MMMQVEARMVNADRCLNMLKIPQEYMSGYMSKATFKELHPGWPTQGAIEFVDVTL